MFVYFVRSISTGTEFYNYVKIGRTNNIKRRIRELKTSSPHALELVYFFKAKDSVYAEKFLHRYYSERRLTREWFDLDASDFKEEIMNENWKSRYGLTEEEYVKV